MPTDCPVCDPEKAVFYLEDEIKRMEDLRVKETVE